MENLQPYEDHLYAPIVSFLQFFIKPAHKEAFERFMLRILSEARQHEGCLWAYSYKAEDMTLQYIVVSGWDTAMNIQDFEEMPRPVRAARMGQEEFFERPMIMRRYKRFEEQDFIPAAR